jgi:hypothetical protein
MPDIYYTDNSPFKAMLVNLRQASTILIHKMYVFNSRKSLIKLPNM